MTGRTTLDEPAHGGASPRARALHASRTELGRLLDSDIIGIVVSDVSGHVLDANDAFLRMIGHARADVDAGALRWDAITPPEWRHTDMEAIAELHGRGVAPGWEKEYVHADGRRVPVLIGAALLEGSATDTVCYVIDNTRRKFAEDALKRLNEELEQRVRQRTASLQASEARADEAARALALSEQQLRALADRLQTVREADRTQVAREIHDVLGQELTGLKMDATFLLRRVEQPGERPTEAIVERLHAMIAQLDATLLTVRRIATALRPGVLDDLGIVSALKWQAREFQTRTGIAVELSTTADELTIDPTRATAIFRIYQELLTNVARHAGARRVQASLSADAHEVVLEVRDDGRGIAEHEASNTGSLGLIGIRERALMIGGEFTIGGEPGTGTCARLRLPMAAGSGPA